MSRTWTDYDGDEPYGDFEIVQSGNPSMTVNLRSIELGTGLADPWTGGGGSGWANSKYYHADLIGTTRLLSDASGSASAGTATVFTAFGERIAGAMPTAGTRYGYAGEWGYQTHADFPFLHVGHRYYDPSNGRFIQRDPIGIAGDLNLYAYGQGAPTLLTDPSGLTVISPEFVDEVAKTAKAAAQLGKMGADDLLSKGSKRFVKGDTACLNAIGTTVDGVALAPDITRIWAKKQPLDHILRDHPDNPHSDPNCAECRRLRRVLNPTLPAPRKPVRRPPPGVLW